MSNSVASLAWSKDLSFLDAVAPRELLCTASVQLPLWEWAWMVVNHICKARRE